MSTAERLRREGFERGCEHGRAQTLLQLIGRRFGPVPAEVEARVRAADAADLDRLTARILDAKNLRELFEG